MESENHMIYKIITNDMLARIRKGYFIHSNFFEIFPSMKLLNASIETEVIVIDVANGSLT